ncbi:hypothetical protein LV84_03921 [Algoriphagus ratkowskyi]|uniref:Antitoxin Phd_YefM of type II toxin-antitoxin system n=1 Tax=Algoriphagus ratkowskyi TaxID=57028 RepID=A0A2W7R932_9BACT|nr:hypothetical protein [Algoriphagus ratkowskyi]PZX50729.1 hypothetical protein LV84_03921 [Algoriphagus ratkowskyi]TXD75783.1 hypothetical protein ESW18_19065 [Algoriphagus ratkowskyi]
MLTIDPKFITDRSGKKISVVLPIKDFEAMMEQLEDLEDIRLYDEGKKSEEPSISIDEAFEIIESIRKGE